MDARHPADPRSNPNHRERGPAKLLFTTYPAIAAALRLKVDTVRHHASRGVFDPRDLESTVRYMAARLDGRRPRCRSGGAPT